MPSLRGRCTVSGRVCFKSFKKDHLEILSIPSCSVVSRSWHYENVVVRPSFVVFLWLLGNWLKVAERAECKLVRGQQAWTRQANVQSENVNY